MADGSIPQITSKIHTVRQQAVILDSDLAKIYGSTTMALNQAVSRNIERFPERFSFIAEREEVTTLKSQNVISKSGRGGRRKPPRVFTEHGALMASTILRSKEAITMSIYIIEAFVKMREEMATNREVLQRLAEIDKNLLQQDNALFDIYSKLLPLLEPVEENLSKKRTMAFPQTKLGSVQQGSGALNTQVL